MIEQVVKEQIKNMFKAGAETGVVLNTFSGVSKSTIYRLRSEAQAEGKPEESRYLYPPKPVGVISDTHWPFTHPRYLEFCRDTFMMAGVDEVVHIGDLIDNHAMSFHESEPDGHSAGAEFERAMDMAHEWYETFPKATWLSGNHDNIPKRKVKAMGLTKRVLRENLYDTPPGWVNRDFYIKDDVYYFHGMGAAGVNGARTAALHKGMSCVIGHSHSFAGVKLIANPFQIMFGMNVGCGIDIESYAMAYGKDFQVRPVMACGLVYNSQMAVVVPMDMRRYSRHNK